MIDFIKTKHIANLNNSDLDWHVSVSEKTGEVKELKIYEFRGLTFIDKGNRLFIKGSLHKYFNEGLHNYNDFTLQDIKLVVDDLNTRFEIDPELTELENLEFGVNIELPFKPDRVLNSVVLHRGEPFNKFSHGKGVECNHAQYYIKIYDKGKQYRVNKNLLRVEVKVIKMAYFKSNGINIKTIADLTNSYCLKGLGELLHKTINEILFTDTKLLYNPDIPENDRLIISNGSNPNYWNSIRPDSNKYLNRNNNPEYKRHRKKYYREIERFEKVLVKYSSNLKLHIADKVRDKFTDLLTRVEFSETIKKRDKFTDPKTAKGTTLPLVYSVSLSPACLVCNKDISHKKKTAKYCSKKCKNKHTNPLLNPKNNLKRRVNKIKRYPELFPVESFLTPQQIELLISKNTIYK